MAGFRLTLSLIAIVATATAALAKDDAVPNRRAVVVENVDFYGGDLEPRFDTTFDQCENICLSDAACTAFTYNIKSSACFPKAGFDEMRAYDGALSARIVDLSDDTRSLIESRAADLNFLPGGYLEEAYAFAQQIGVEFPPADREFNDLLLAARRNGAREAVALYGAALNISDVPDVWGDLSRAFLRIKNGRYSEKRSWRKRGTAAAINGRLSFQLSKREGTLEALDSAISKYGFRILNHTVDSNAAAPRICMSFSEELASQTEYGPFVRVDRRDLPIEAEGKQLCIDGVEHGGRYKFTVRKGLPSANGEKLNRSVDLNVYVRDRNPSARFTGRAYVLPKSAKASVPLVSVNIDEVALRIHRVGVRNLRTVAQRNMLGEAIDGYEEREITRDLGTPVWEGFGEVKNRLNEDVTTSLPIGDAISKFEPGVYVMTARVGTAEDWIDAATQWFVVTDLGLTTLSGVDGLHVFARSLANAEAIEDAEVQLIASNNEVLATGTTNDEGYLIFSSGLTRGEGGMSPSMITVENSDGDFTFLDLTQSGFDLSDRGVEGRASPGPIDIFVSTERGAYRPGETVNATILARDATAMAVSDLPLTAIITRPDGVEHARMVLKDQGAGGRSHSFDLDPGAARGAWQLAIYADPDASVLARESFLVEDFTPERIDFDLEIEAETLRITDVPDLMIEGRYL